MWADATLVPERATRRGLAALLFHGIFSQSWDTLTAGAFLVGFALALGADNLTIGLLAAIPQISQLLQIPAVYLVERVRRRKLITVIFGLGNRTIWTLLALIPLLARGQAGLVLLLTGILLASSLGAFIGVAWNSWIRDFVPQPVMGRYFGARLRVSVAFGMVVGLLGGFFVTYWRQAFPDSAIVAYTFVFGMAGLFAYLSLWFLSRVPEPRYDLPAQRVGLLTFLGRPLRDAAFRDLLIFLFLWSFGTNLALPFFTVYMLRRLGFSFASVIVFTTISQLSYMLFVNAWGRLDDRFGSRAVLYISGVLLVLTIIAFPFTNMPARHVMTVPMLVLIHIFGGMATSGVNLSTTNIALKASPHGAASAYMTANGLVTAAAMASAPLISGALADFFSPHQLAVRLVWIAPAREMEASVLHFQGLDFVFFLAFVIGLFALYRLPFIKEQGTVTEKLDIEHVARELTREVKGIASIAGLRSLATSPITLASLAKEVLVNEPPRDSLDSAATDPGGGEKTGDGQ